MLSLVENPGKPSLDSLIYPSHTTIPKPHLEPVVEGWDTETSRGKTEDEGFCRIIANSQAWFEIEDFDTLFRVLTSKFSKNRRNFFFNLDFDVTAIFKWRLDILEGLVKNNYVKTKDGNIRIAYIPKKLLKIRKGKDSFFYYDIFQFYNTSLKKASMKYLGVEAHALKDDRDNLSNHTVEAIGEYCQDDSLKCKLLAELFYSRLHKINLYPKHLISKGNIAQFALLTTANVPTWKDVPKNINEFAWSSFRAGWIDVWQRGRLNVWTYDINSAYPSTMLKLPDFRKGVWVNEAANDGQVGFAKIAVKYNPNTPPLLSSWLGLSHYYPNCNEWTTATVTLNEYRFLKSLINIDLIGAVTFIPSTDETPWNDFIQKMVKTKNENKNDPALYMVCKEIVNSGYGKTCERVERLDGVATGRLFNPVAAATITGNCRVQLAEAVKDHMDSVVAVSTDGLAMTKPLALDCRDVLGAWSEKATKMDSVFVQPGVYQLANDDPHNRGFRMPKDEDGKPLTLFQLLNSDAEEIEVLTTRPITAREAFHRNNPGLANVFTERPYHLSYNNQRRLWLDVPTCFRDLLDKSYRSIPIPLTLQV